MSLAERGGWHRAVRRRARALIVRVGAASLLPLTACDRAATPQSATQPSAVTQPVAERIATDPILPESHGWTREEAVASLADETRAVSAALRLVRLSDSPPATFAEPFSMEAALRLRVVQVAESLRVCGFADAKDARRLSEPQWIDASGAVRAPEPGDGWVLHVAGDPDVFPNLIIRPTCVVNAGDPTVTALVLSTPDTLAFDLRFDGGVPYVALLMTAKGAGVEVGRYAWEPYEQTFLGPATDKLPDPPGGVFKLDLRASTALQPVGGLIEEPDAVTRPPELDWPADDDVPPPY